MTISEFKAGYTSASGFADENSRVIAFDISEDGSSTNEDFTVLSAGVIAAEFDFSPRTAVRHFVEGDRTVPLSDMRVFIIKLVLADDDPVQSFILAAAASQERVRYVYYNACTGIEESGYLLPELTGIEKNDIYGMTARVLLRKC